MLIQYSKKYHMVFPNFPKRAIVGVVNDIRNMIVIDPITFLPIITPTFNIIVSVKEHIAFDTLIVIDCKRYHINPETVEMQITS